MKCEWQWSKGKEEGVVPGFHLRESTKLNSIWDLNQFCCVKYQLITAKYVYESPRECNNKMSRVVRKPAFCICENKDADQLRGNRESDQRLCFCYMDSKIPLLPKSEISSL